jgi:3-hydroxymyristoyl/3-hydroxydecanoyl-(acyl carrier protein) dehydratase
MRPSVDAVGAVREAVAKGDGAQGLVRFAADLPVLAGHFPGHSLIPGVHLLAVVAEVARRSGVARGSVRAIERAKWSAPAFPDQDLRISLSSRVVDDGWRIDGEVSGPAGLCATCRLLLSEA